MTSARSNRKTPVTFTQQDRIVADKVHGGGFGAFAKMVDRAIVACTGWTVVATKVEFDAGRVVFVNRVTGERSVWQFAEVQP